MLTKMTGRGPVASAGLFVLCCLTATSLLAGAQTPAHEPDLRRWEGRFVHEAWTVKDGLPVNSINAVVQTRDGYIWAATFDGLVRFDGVRFTIFNSTNHDSLPSNRIINLLEGRDGTLWLSTQSHLVRFRGDRFTQIGKDRGLTGRFVGVHEDAAGRVWIMTTDGLGLMRDDRFVMVLPAPIGGLVSSVIQRRDGSTWIGTTSAGLYRIVEVPGSVTMRAIQMARVDSAEVRTLFEDPTGRLWIGTSRGVWFERNGLSKVISPDHPLLEVRRFVHSAADGAVYAHSMNGIFRVDAERVVAFDPRPHVVVAGPPIAADHEGRLWHATGSELSREGRTVLALGPDPDQARASTVITSMVVDHEGSVWFGTRAAGLHRVKRAFITSLSEPEGISHRNVYPIHQSPSGDVWVGTYGNGISRVHSDGRITNYTPGRGYPSTIQSLYADRSNRLWVGARDGLYGCTLPSMVCTRDTSPVLGPTAYAFHEDSAGLLWAGFGSGPMRLHAGRWTAVPGWPNAGTVRAFAETRDGAIWIGTNGGGIVRFHDGTFTRVTAADDGLPIDLVRALHVDAEGLLWVGTEGRGLARLDPLAWHDGSGHTDRRIVSVRARDGLFDEVIHQILEDDAGRLWMSSNRGIFWVARDELNAFAERRITLVRSTGYTEHEGMRNREANGGMQPAGIRARDGRLWFPTQDGVAILDPARVASGRSPPRAIVERVVAGDSASVPAGAALEFGVHQRDLQVEYTALTFLEPANVRFRYRLDPYDADWVDAGSRRTAFYTRVPPGRYTFRVMASNESGVWAGTEASVALRLAPRFHETRGALALGIAAFGVFVVAGYRRRVGNLRRRERELSREVAARTAELRHNEGQLKERNAQLATQAETLARLHTSRSRLFANLSHEFRTPLTLILGPLGSLIAGRHGTLTADVQEQHGLMQRNGQRLLRLINQVLDLSSLQAGAVTLELRSGDLVEFARMATMAFAPLAERQGIELRFHSETPELRCAFDAEQLEKVLFNLLSNAHKFTEQGGTVELAVRPDGEMAEIAVRDTGIGISPEELPRVFDRFHQSDTSPTRRHGGTGIGLALVKELVDLHGGEVHAASVLGTGSTFTVRLPVGTTSLRHGSVSSGGAASRNGGTHLGPVAQVADECRMERAVPNEIPEADRTTVLVVDDNADVRAFVRSILQGTYQVIEACDGEEGLATARTVLPDMIVADVMMPQLDGLALGRALKEDLMTDAIPVVLLTARAAAEDHVAGLESGADAYLVKPFDAGVLEATVANLLAQRRRLRERFRQGVAAPPTTTAQSHAALDRRLRPLVEAHLADPDFGPDALAASAALSYHQLYRSLRDELGVTPSHFIRRVRVECAAELLRQRAGSVTEIAYSVGFESLSYFRRAYHERFDSSPSEHLAARTRSAS